MTLTEKVARRLFENWNAAGPFEPLRNNFAITSLDEAYAVQSKLQDLHRENRGDIAGRKIALTSKAMQQMIGAEKPVSGAIFSKDIHISPAKIEASSFVRLGLEFELSFELGQPVTPQASPHSCQSVQHLIAAVRPAFELIEDRNADYSSIDLLDIVCDNAWCGGVVLGPKLENWSQLDLSDTPSRVFQKGHPVEETNIGAADPLGSLAWVLNHFGERGVTLAEGEHIITGSAVRTRFPSTGDQLAYEVSGTSVEIELV